MIRVRLFCLLACAGLTAPLAADQVVSKSDLQRPYGSASVPVRTDRPSFDDAAYAEAKRRGQDEILAGVIARAPAPEAGATPNYHYIRGHAVPKVLRGSEIGLLVDKVGAKAEVIEAAVAAARAAGLEIEPAGHRASNSWAILRLSKPAADANAMNALIEQVLKAPGVRVASPVFENAFIDGGYYMPTDRVLVRVKAELDVVDTINTLAGGFEVANARLGSMDGAMTLRSTLRNGFQILAQANRLFESGAFAWSTPAALETLEQHVLTPNDTDFNLQWVHRNTGQDWIISGSNVFGLVDFDMDTDQAWDITTGRSAVRVFVMDSGVQTTHPDYDWFDGRDFTTGEANGIGNGAPGNACDNHGTAVAGCAAALINNSTGVAGTGGACQVMSGKIGDQETGPCSSRFAAYSNEWLVNAIDWGRDNGAKVTNASIGVGQDDAVEDMYTSAWNSGLLHFASAGNGGSDSIGDNGSGFPGSAPFTISVIAVDPDGTKSGFSNFGTNCDLCAGGTVVRATDRTGTNGYNGTSGTGGDYTYFSGTSAASPLAAGVGLLFFSQHGFATPSQARTAIFASCVDIGAAGIDTTFQRGHINAFGALKENAPANDDCNTPNIINPNGGNVVYHWIMDTTWATPSRLEPDPSCTGSDQNSVFFRFTADHDGTVVIHTAGSAYDTVISVFDGCPSFNANGDLTASPAQTACNDDFNGTLQSQVSFSMNAGDTALIRVSKFGTLSGGGTLDFNFAFNFAVPANDLCSNAVEIDDPETGNFNFNPPVYDTFHAGSSTCEPDETCGSTTNSDSVFYRFVPEHDGTITVDTIGSNYDTVLSIHSGCGLGLILPPNPPSCLQPTHYACNDDIASGNLQSRIQSFAVTRGSAYIIEVSRFGTSTTNVARLLDFNFSYSRSIPDNNGCSAATIIPGNNIPGGITNYNPAPSDVFYATSSACDPDACGRPGPVLYHSVWYRFTPQYSGAINVNTVGSGYDTYLLIQTSCATLIPQPFPNPPICLSVGTTLACNDNISTLNLDSQILNFSVSGGTTYYFMVGSKDEFVPNGNGDGILDFNLQYQADNCPADFNGDGNLDPDDLGDFINCYFSMPPCPGADFNGDANIDPDDLGDFINAYFAGC
ncbi:MAG: S8 family serine peptidase [Phycisphaerales bacterium]